MTDITLEAQKMAVTRAIEAHGNAKALLFAHDGKTPINAPTVHCAGAGLAVEDWL